MRVGVRRNVRASAAFVAMLALASCRDGEFLSANDGNEGGPCHADRSCNGWLVCQQGICEAPPDAAPVPDATPAPDATPVPDAMPTPDATPAPDVASVPDAAPPDAALSCPDDMVLIPLPLVCIDRYEASEGVGGAAVSVAGVLPWANIDHAGAGAACAAAGKRLCTEPEWMGACRGPGAGTVFPYGDVYEPTTCNGWDNGVHAAVPTGSKVDCEGGYPGLFDMSGNLREWTATCGGGNCRTKGGAFNSDGAYGDYFLRCANYNNIDPSVAANLFGFRCCLTP